MGPLPCFPSLLFTITQSGASGIADHILPLGDLFLTKNLVYKNIEAQIWEKNKNNHKNIVSLTTRRI